MIGVTGVVQAKATTAEITKIMAKTELETVALAVKQAGLALERNAKITLTQSGRHRPGTPTPSQPGSPPAIITGSLRASVKTGSPTKIGFGTYMVQVGPTMVYGRVQELGGGPNNLPARPYMAPALNNSKDEIYAIYNAVWTRSTR